MGILDDAIREHLELKRQHGAESDDLERLEKEAFGAPARPGDPEFATGEEPAVADAPEAGTEAPAAEPPAPAGTAGNTDDWLVAEDETTVAPEAPAPAESASPAEQARTEHAHLDDTADHPAPEGEAESAELDVPSFEEPAPPAEPEPSAEEQPAVAPTPEPEPPAPEPEPPAMEEPLPPAGDAEPPEAPERGIFDAGDEFDFDDDLDLELDEEDDGTVGPQSADAEAPPASPEPLPPEDATEVQPAPSFVEDDTDNPPLPVQPPAAAPEEDEGDKPEGEDLLEETPDFLQDAPEGEDLWFEQGPPKDFDFDDD